MVFLTEEEVKKAQEDWEKKKKEKKAQPKPVFLKDYQRQVLLENGGIIDEEAELPKKKELTYVEEQRLLKEAFSKTTMDSDDSGDEDEFFSHRIKTKAELEKEEDDFKTFMLQEKKKVHIFLFQLVFSFSFLTFVVVRVISLQEDQQKANDLEALQRYWTDPNLTTDEKFLRDYVLERAWIEKDKGKIPTYDDVIAAEGSEEELEHTEEFEKKYNFRHEEE